MDALSASIVNHVIAASQANVQLAASTAVLKKALDLQSANAAALMQALPTPAVTPSATLGTLVDTWA